jgi:hypothetical protein
MLEQSFVFRFLMVNPIMYSPKRKSCSLMVIKALLSKDEEKEI